MYRKRMQAALALAALWSLCGCFTYQEEIAFDEDGAGTLVYSFERGRQGLLTKLASEASWDNPVEDGEKLKAEKPAGLVLEKFVKQDNESTNRATFEGTFRAEHLDKFSAWKGHAEVEQVFGGISLRRVNDDWIFERKLAAPADLVEKAQKETMNSKVTLKLTGPGKLLDHNGDKVEKKNTVVWEGTFADFVGGQKGGGVLRARFSVAKLNTMAVAAIGAIVFVVLAVVVIVSRKRPAATAE